jgi:ribosome biogenesis GTPase A
MTGCNLIVEVLDARDTEGTRLALVERWAGTWRLLKVANKSDLADAAVVEKNWKAKLYPLNSETPRPQEEREKFISFILNRVKQRPVRALVVGYPNVGKSSLINLLVGKKSAKASPVAGTTKSLQWLRVTDDILVLDTPGVYPKFEKKEELLFKNAVNVDGLLNPEAYALKVIERVLKDADLKAWLEAEFDFEFSKEDAPVHVLEKIALRRGWLLKGGEPNINQSSKAVLRAYMKAPKLG